MKTRAICLLVFAALALAVGVVGLARGPKLEVGGLYSIETGKGGYGVAKVLALDSAVVHVRAYKESFQKRPAQVEEHSLTLGSLRDPDGFGMGHLPLSRKTFAAWKPQLIKVSPVTAEELKAYEEWKKSGGGLWQ
jgi:hypothetical protein